MTKEAKKALKESIKHWERLASGKRRQDEGIGAEYCALCTIYNPPGLRKDGLMHCNGCPVKERTGKEFCQRTPYQDIEVAAVEFATLPREFVIRSKTFLNMPKFRKLALKELEFLRSLLENPRHQEGTP